MGQWGDVGWRVVEGWGGGFGRRDMGVGGDVGLMEEWGGLGVPLMFDPTGATPASTGEAEDIGVTEGDEEGTKGAESEEGDGGHPIDVGVPLWAHPIDIGVPLPRPPFPHPTFLPQTPRLWGCPRAPMTSQLMWMMMSLMMSLLTSPLVPPVSPQCRPPSGCAPRAAIPDPYIPEINPMDVWGRDV